MALPFLFNLSNDNHQFYAMGLQTSIDDFGTGYSSLGSLTQFPINTIKIDRTFVKEITANMNAHAIVKAVISMAHSLNIEVVAEGVEIVVHGVKPAI